MLSKNVSSGYKEEVIKKGENVWVLKEPHKLKILYTFYYINMFVIAKIKDILL